MAIVVLLVLLAACAYASGENAFNCETGWKKSAGCTLTPGDVPVISGDGKNATWQPGGGGAGDITAVGDCTTGACFTDGTNNGAALVYEGATVNANQTTLTFTGDPGAAYTVTIPNETGTVCTSASGSTCGTGTPNKFYQFNIGGTVHTPDSSTDIYTFQEVSGGGIDVSTAGDDTAQFDLDYSAAPSSNSIGSRKCVMSNDIISGGLGGILCEGNTANAIETYITLAEPTTTDKIITFPDQTGNVFLDTSTATLTGDVTASGVLTGLATTIGANKVLESHLKAVDSASDEECLTYETTTGDFEWQSCGGGAGDITTVGDCTTGDCFVDGTSNGSKFVYEGATINANMTTLTFTGDPGAAYTVTIPNETGTLCTTGSVCTGYGDITDVWSVTTGNANALTAASGDTLDAGSANSSKPCVRSATLPGTCAEGDCYQDTDSGNSETSICTATNTWVKLGDVSGPSSATDNAIVRYDGTTGKLAQNGATTVDDTTGMLNFPDSLGKKLDLYGDRYMIAIESGYEAFYSESKFRWRGCGDSDCSNDAMFATLSAEGLLVHGGAFSDADPSSNVVGDFFEPDGTPAILRVRNQTASIDSQLTLKTLSYQWDLIAEGSANELHFRDAGGGVTPLILYGDGDVEMLEGNLTVIDTTTSTVGRNGIKSTLTASPASAASSDYIGVHGSALTGTGQNFTGSVSGIYGRGQHNQDSTAALVAGVYGTADSNSSSGTATLLTGAYLDAAATGGTVTTVAGLYVDTIGTGATITDSFAIFTEGTELTRFGGAVKVKGDANDSVTGDFHVHDLTGESMVSIEADGANQDAVVDLISASRSWTMRNDESASRLLLDSSTGGADAGIEIETDGTVWIYASDDMNLILSNDQTNAQWKQSGVFMQHYDTSEQPLTALWMDSYLGMSVVHVGGGTSKGNAAENISFYTAASDITTTGTEAMRILNDQSVAVLASLQLGSINPGSASCTGVSSDRWFGNKDCDNPPVKDAGEWYLDGVSYLLQSSSGQPVTPSVFSTLVYFRTGDANSTNELTMDFLAPETSCTVSSIRGIWTDPIVAVTGSPTITFTMRKNASASGAISAACTTSGTSCTGSGTLSFTAGDRYSFNAQCTSGCTDNTAFHLVYVKAMALCEDI